jgi:hypothetical protein
MLSTFWISSREAARQVHVELEAAGFAVGHDVKSPSGLGIWLTVKHQPEDLAKVTTMITTVDSAATNEGSEFPVLTS